MFVANGHTKSLKQNNGIGTVVVRNQKEQSVGSTSESRGISIAVAGRSRVAAAGRAAFISITAYMLIFPGRPIDMHSAVSCSAERS